MISSIVVWRYSIFNWSPEKFLIVPLNQHAPISMYRISNRSQFIMRAKLTSRRANEARFLARERTANTCPVCRTHRQGEEADIVRPDNEVAISLKDNERTPPFENYTKTQNTRGCGNWLEASLFHRLKHLSLFCTRHSSLFFAADVTGK